MAKYTIELRELVENGLEIFDFDYPFYEPYQKNRFEETFINYYYFYEIGAETITRWKHMLKTQLNLLYTKYEQLYYTILRSQNIDFMLNKDLKESWTRELDTVGKEYNYTTNLGNENTENNITLKNTEDYKNSSLENGLASTNLDNLTDISNTSTKAESDNNAMVTKNYSTQGNVNQDENQKEKYSLISQGNIGTTSSAQLLRDWRSVLIDLQEMLIKDLRCLFMYVY